MNLARTCPKFFIYACVVFLVGAVCLGYWAFSLTASDWVQVLVFAVLAATVELVPTQIPREPATVAPGFAVIYAALVACGVPHAAWVAAIGTLRLRDLKGQVPWPTVLFNRGQLAVSACGAGVAFIAAGGSPGAVRLSADIPALLLAGLVFYVMNVSFVVGASALFRNVRFWATWKANYRWDVPSFLGLIPLGAVLAVLYLQVGWISLVLGVLPLIVSKQSFQRYVDVREAYVQTMAALTSALDAKDAYTRGHCDRVSELAMAIGRELHLPEDKLELLAHVGRLHDVGKIGIRDAVLKKPGIFTPGEYGEMQMHAVLGADIVDRISLLGEGTKWVMHHHERFDGAGFPAGLQGEAIPLGARIIAVADAYDALTSDRPYKKALGREEALAELRRCAGRQFDPQLVDVLAKVVGVAPAHAREEAEAQAAATRSGGEGP
ncbi:MAG: HD-GYP domain-containing protein [Bacillota bacterium]|nr:HD-GYP domain-containing protein [Bacillota bacterium]